MNMVKKYADRSLEILPKELSFHWDWGFFKFWCLWENYSMSGTMYRFDVGPFSISWWKERRNE